MADILGVISNIRFIAIAAAIIAVVFIVWKISSDLKGWNPLGGIFPEANADGSKVIHSAKEEIREEIDQTESSYQVGDEDGKYVGKTEGQKSFG